MGFSHKISLSTLAYSQENRPWEVFADFAQTLIEKARILYKSGNEFDIDIPNPVYAFDSSTIDLCLSLFQWATFRKTKAAIKLHTLLDLRGNIPVFIHITEAKVHDVNALDEIPFETNGIYIFDKGYLHFKRLYKIHLANAFFVIRPKVNLKYEVISQKSISRKDQKNGVQANKIIRLQNVSSFNDYPQPLRMVTYWDKEKERMFSFLTNNFTISSLEVAMLYKSRWKIELFFKWIKQHLRIKSFWGQSQNAVKCQIWIAVSTYLLVAIWKKKLGLGQSIYEILQILSISVFDKTPINQLLAKNDEAKSNELIPKQLNIFDL
jgi:transposase